MYRGMNEPQVALKYLDKSRSLYQFIKNQVKEAATLKLAGEIYLTQGEKQKAIA